MVDEIITRQELIDAKRDAHDLGKAVNEKVIVSPRYGEDFKSLPMIAAEFQDAINTIVVEDGVPAVAVSDASGKTQQELNTTQALINSQLYNVPENYGADPVAIDNTAALQAWLDSSDVLHIRPFKTYKFSGTLDLNKTNQTIIGITHNTYGNSRLVYTGTGTALRSTKNIGYFTLRSMQLIGEVTTANAVFENGTIGLDLSLGGTVDAEGIFINGFETLSKSEGTTFYNKFVNCRFSDFRDGFSGYAAYNLNFLLCRFLQFTNAISTVGGAGPLNINSCSFERFNGSIHRSNNDKCELNFHNNYVETFDKIPLPVNFVKTPNQPLGDYFGGNILFLGYYGKLSIRNNKLSLGGVFRLGSFSACDHLDSVGNGISLYQTGNNLGMLFSTVSQYKTVNVNDIYNSSLTGDGGYSRAYARSSFNSISNLRNPYVYYDCILDAVQPLVARLVTFTPALILNGWTISTNAGGNSVKALSNADGTTTIVGAVNGTAKTGDVILNIPAANRPLEIGTTQAYVLFFTKSQLGVADCVLKYTYSSGDLAFVSGATPLSDIVLNIVIPQRV